MTPPSKERLDGSFALVDLPRLVMAPCRDQLSGALWLDTKGASRRIVYSSGWPIAASSNAADEQIEAHLLENNVISPPQLQKAIALRTSKKIELQQALSDLKLLSKTTFVDQLVELRKRIIVNALAAPCQARFEASSVDPVGFSYLPLLECCMRAVTAWPPAEQKVVLQSPGTRTLTVLNADFAMTVGAPQTLLGLMQRLTREPRTCAQIFVAEPTAHTELIVAIAANLIGTPQEIALGESTGLDAELNDALSDLQKHARPRAWDAILPTAVERQSPNRVNLIAPVSVAVLLTALITWRLSRSEPPEPIVDNGHAPPPQQIVEPPASQPSLLAAAAERAKEQAAKSNGAAPRVKLTAEERTRVDALFARGNVWAKKNKPAAAIHDYKAALEIDPTAPLMHRALAIAYTRNGDIDPAIFEYKVYLRLAPMADDADSVRDIIEAYESKNR